MGYQVTSVPGVEPVCVLSLFLCNHLILENGGLRRFRGSLPPLPPLLSPLNLCKLLRLLLCASNS